MEELFIHLLAGIFQFIAESVLEIFGEELLARGLSSVIGGTREGADLTTIVAGFLLFGLLCGAVSLAFFPCRFLHLTRLHGIGLILNPLTAGAICLGWAGSPQLERQKSLRLHTFARGFSFALGFTLARFFLAR